MTEFFELVKDAPNFNAMERGELVAYAYATFAAGTKADSENAKLRELASELLRELVKADGSRSHGWLFEAARELRIEVKR